MGSNSCVQHWFPTRLSTEGCFPAPSGDTASPGALQIIPAPGMASGLQVEFRKAPSPAPCVQV